ncbi:MAG TPA: AAA family ATPase, partial [Myxococcota bacterium]
KQPFDLTMLPRTDRDGSTKLSLHLTGTEYFEDVDDAVMNELRDLWDDTLVSEDASVARAEYLATSILFAALDGKEGAATLEQLEAARLAAGGLAGIVGDVARARYDEGYERGVHDSDAVVILDALLHLRRQAGKLAHSPKSRALAALFTATVVEADRAVVTARVRGTARLLLRFADSVAGKERVHALATTLKAALLPIVGDVIGIDDDDARAAAAALVDEVGPGDGEPSFVLSSDAQALCDALFSTLDKAGERDAFERDLQALSTAPAEQLSLVTAWLRAVLDSPATEAVARSKPALFEAAVHLMTRGRVARTASAAMSALVVDGLFSQHARIVDRKLEVRLDEILPRLRRFSSQRVPRFLRLKQRRQEVIDERRRALRISEFAPKVLASFVRNRLINDVYLHLVGNNLAKQMGAAGDKKRADLMGMLLLISPPGYGKTTLMEYVAQRLGLFYVKVNGPSLGHDVTSLDPNEAPDATSRQEVEKLNFAFELGNNVLLLIDDIQHTSPEFLQKFISLCDGTRRVEGVWRGKTRTYDLRGKRFVVCMAGNPYTETGDKFRIPDMLANRADTYNLGDVSGGKADLFASSFVENALTANPVTQPLAGRDPADVHLLLRLAAGEPVATTDLKHSYAAAELDEIVRVLQMLQTVQNVLVKVNATYVSSAATDDRFRTEPPFKLQGSYRNMAKLAQGVVPVMNPDELQRLITDHYKGESQTLTTGAEANLLKLGELRGRLTPEETIRWNDIRKNFERLQLQGDSNDPATRVAGTLATLTQRVEGIATTIDVASKAAIEAQTQSLSTQTQAQAHAQQHAQQSQATATAAIDKALTTLSTSVATALTQLARTQLQGQQQALQADQEAASTLTQTITQLGSAVSAPVQHLAKEIEKLRSEQLTFAQAKEQARIKERSIDERRAVERDDRAKQAAATDPAVLSALEQVSTSLQQAQLAVTVHNPANPGITDLVRLQTILIEASLLPLVRGLASSIEHEKENAERLEAALVALKSIEAKGVVGVTGDLTATSTHRPFKPKVQGTRADEK